jgi:hypothetical protein
VYTALGRDPRAREDDAGLVLDDQPGEAGDPIRARHALAACGRRLVYFSGFVPAIQMMTRENLPSASTSKKLQLCMSFFVPSASSPM